MSTPALPDRITAYLERSGLAREITTVLPLTGDASDRRYFRALRRVGPSRVLALHVEPFDPDVLPFCRVAQLLGSMPLPIPAILDRAGDLGILLLEDLGDVTLQAHLGAAPAAEHRRLYRDAVGLIETLQRRGAELAAPEYSPYGVAFDVVYVCHIYTERMRSSRRRAACARSSTRRGVSVAASSNSHTPS